MKYLKKFERFTSESASPEVKPGSPTTKPGTKPKTNPSKPSPIRRDRPAPGTEPAPKAEKKMPKSTAKQVSERFIELANAEGIDYKKYFRK